MGEVILNWILEIGNWKMSKEKRYKKSALREALERNMREQRKEPALTVSPMEFSRWLKIYVETFGLDERICQSKTLNQSVADAFGEWLGYSLR